MRQHFGILERGIQTCIHLENGCAGANIQNYPSKTKNGGLHLNRLRKNQDRSLSKFRTGPSIIPDSPEKEAQRRKIGVNRR